MSGWSLCFSYTRLKPLGCECSVSFYISTSQKRKISPEYYSIRARHSNTVEVLPAKSISIRTWVQRIYSNYACAVRAHVYATSEASPPSCESVQDLSYIAVSFFKCKTVSVLYFRRLGLHINGPNPSSDSELVVRSFSQGYSFLSYFGMDSHFHLWICTNATLRIFCIKYLHLSGLLGIFLAHWNAQESSFSVKWQHPTWSFFMEEGVVCLLSSVLCACIFSHFRLQQLWVQVVTCLGALGLWT